MTLATIVGAEDPSQTHHWLWPEGYELLFGVPASLLIFALLWWKAGPLVKKGMKARTDRIQAEIDGANQAVAGADAEARQIRQALGDIGTERSRLLAEADAQAEALLTDGRARLDAEIADLHAKADADIAASAARGSDEMRYEIGRLAALTADRVVAETLDADAQQRLIEEYIQRVGSGARV